MVGSMSLREGSSAQCAMRGLIYPSILAVAMYVSGVSGNASGNPPRAVPVRNPAQFQEAVRSGVAHIVINEHLDMTTTPRFSETTIMDAGMIAIVSNPNGGWTRTIRVRGCLMLFTLCNLPCCEWKKK